MIREPSRGHHNCCIFIAQMLAVTHQLLNQMNKIRQTERQIYPPSFVISTQHLLKTSHRPHTKREFAVLVSGQFSGYIFLNYWLREIPLSAFADRFELRSEPKQLMLLFYKICLCLPGESKKKSRLHGHCSLNIIAIILKNVLFHFQ